MVGLLRDCCGIAAGLLWECSVIAVGLLCDYREIALGFVLDCLRFLWGCCGIAVVWQLDRCGWID